MRVHETELHGVRVFGAQSGIAANHVACVLPVFHETQLLRIWAAHATSVAEFRLARVRKVVDENRAGKCTRVVIGEHECRHGQIQVCRDVLESQAGLRLHLRDLPRQHGVGCADVLCIVERGGPRDVGNKQSARSVEIRCGEVVRG